MTSVLYLVILIVAFVAVYFLGPPVLGAYVKYRGKRIITCPETKRPAAIDVDATHAALTAALGRPDLRLKDCSRWPARSDCGEECLLQVEAWPKECLVGTIVKDWYAGKKCVFCGSEFGAEHFLEHKPALLGVDGKTIEWIDVRPELLPDVLANHKPVCWNCHIAETFRREHPEMVLDRSYSDGAGVGKR